MWARLINVIIGVCLMAAPAIGGYEGFARINDLVVGALTVATAIMAMSEVLRSLRWVNVLLGTWLVGASFFMGFDGGTLAAHVIAAAMVVAAALVPGSIHKQTGGGWSALRRRSA